QSFSQALTHSTSTSPSARASLSTHRLASECDAQSRVAGNLRTGVLLSGGTPTNAATTPGWSPFVSIHARSLPSLIRQSLDDVEGPFSAMLRMREAQVGEKVDCRAAPCKGALSHRPYAPAENANLLQPPESIAANLDRTFRLLLYDALASEAMS